MDQKELIANLENSDFARKTCLQLIKEFDRLGLHLPLEPSSRDQQDIIKIIAVELNVIAREKSELLAQLIYSIDLSEKNVKKSFEESENVINHLAHAFLIRAAQKVYLREKFSSKASIKNRLNN